DANVRAPAMDLHSCMNAGVRKRRRDLRARRLVERHVRDEAPAEKRGRAQLRAVHELIHNQKLAGPKFLFKRAHGADRNDALAAQQLQRVNVRPEVDLTRKNSMSAPMASKKRDTLSFQCSNDDGLGRFSERRFQANFARVRETAHGIESAAADDPDRGFPLFAHTFCVFLFRAGHSLLRGVYPFRSNGRTSILSSCSCNVATGISGSCPNTTIHPLLTMSRSHLRFVSSVCIG